MGSIWSLILCFLFHFMVIYADSSPVEKNRQPLHVLPFIVTRSDGSTVCEDMEAFKWTYTFHDCFISRKYGDGGRDLNSIVDRILYHGEACIETSSRECRPDSLGFITLLNKTITQMKDYAEMYLEEIYKGRENIKDLECIETSLNIKTYEDCFHDIVPRAYKLSEEHLQKVVQEGIFCANRRNSGCSKEAKTSLNRIVRIILGVEQPSEEEFQTETTPTEAPTTEIEQTSEEEHETVTEPAETPAIKIEQTSKEEYETETEPAELPAITFHQTNEEDFETEVRPTENDAPWKWYDYLAYPFVQAWKWISGLFG